MEHTSLVETTDRILATAVTARWLYTSSDIEWDKAFTTVRAALLEEFALTHSLSLQHTLYAMGKGALEAVPEIAEIRLSLPNKHHFLVDLGAWGLDNLNQGFYAADRPHGLIEASIVRDDGLSCRERGRASRRSSDRLGGDADRRRTARPAEPAIPTLNTSFMLRPRRQCPGARLQYGVTAIYGSVIAAGLVMILLAPLFARLVRFFPPLVTGTVILIIGLSLMGVAANWVAGGLVTDDGAPAKNVALAAGTLLFIVLIERFAPAALARISILLGIVLGTILAIPLGMTQWDHVNEADAVGVSTPFHFGFPTFEDSAIVSWWRSRWASR